MSLVTDHEEFVPARDVLSQNGIGVDDVVIRREFSLVSGAAKFTPGRLVEIEVRSAATWAMPDEQRKPIEIHLRASVEQAIPDSDLRVVWAKPIDIEWIVMCSAIQDKVYRDWHRRRIDDDAFEAATDRFHDLHDRVWDRFEDWRPLVPELEAILTEARRHPAPQRELPPLPDGKVDVGEVVSLFRRILDGSVVPELVSPKSGWRDLYHGIGEFTADGWTIHAFKRNEGVKYVQTAIAPDRRTGNFDFFYSREGGPIDLLEDDEQDRLDDIIEALPAAERVVADDTPRLHGPAQ